VQWQRALSAAYNSVGSVMVAQEKLEDALKTYRDALAANYAGMPRSAICRG
jgi:hypothetical protein